jgi:uracil-DNA glycosylase
MNKIKEYQKSCWNTYKSDVKIDPDSRYLYGNPLKVHVPVDTATNGLMIIGAYPTAHFNTIGKYKDVPVEDHLYPFSNEIYFDGSRIRTVDSGRELQELVIEPLGLSREDCWITDLVKVFLFKAGHIKKYESLGNHKVKESRSRFMAYAKNSLEFIHEEIELANPKIILTLGQEVASVFFKVSKNDALKLLSSGINTMTIKNTDRFAIALPHPGILMRNSPASEKWKEILKVQIERIKKHLAQ